MTGVSDRPENWVPLSMLPLYRESACAVEIPVVSWWLNRASTGGGFDLVASLPLVEGDQVRAWPTPIDTYEVSSGSNDLCEPIPLGGTTLRHRCIVEGE